MAGTIDYFKILYFTKYVSYVIKYKIVLKLFRCNRECRTRLTDIIIFIMYIQHHHVYNNTFNIV